MKVLSITEFKFQRLLFLIFQIFILNKNVYIIVGPAIAHDVKGSQYCEFYNETMCGGEFREDCVEKEQCGPHDPDKRNHCYVLWQYDSVTQKSTIKLKVNNLNKFFY